ncbi:unnamed protein product [Clonostachys solani]|uniref:Uncharacterized protein n=1 Tax=Clonostachys solani TaxID=160281 RepID=A0A9P0EBP9_9HYPO|nr:unnamed protein product [Clonostachys solani]
MAPFTPSQQRASQHQGNNSDSLEDPAAPALSTNALPPDCIDPSSLSNEAVHPRSNNHQLQAAAPNPISFSLNSYNSPFVYSPPIQPNTSYTQQTTAQQAYPTGQLNHSYTQQAPVQQAYPPNYYVSPAYPYSSNNPLGPTWQASPLQYQTHYNPSPVTYPQASLRNTAAPPQQPEQQSTRPRQLAPRNMHPPVGMSNGNNTVMQREQSASQATHDQHPTSYAMQKQPATPVRDINRYNIEEVSPRSKPSAVPTEDYSGLMEAAQAHLARLNQHVPQIQGKSPPTTQSRTDSTIPPLSLPAPGQSAAVVDNASTAQTTQTTRQFVDLTRPQPSNAAPQEHQEPETFEQLWDSLDSSGFDSQNPIVISGDQQELPVDFPEVLETNHQAAQAVSGVLSQSSKTLDIPLRSKAVRDELNSALADPSMVVASEVLTSVGTIKAAPTNQHSSAPPTGICPRPVLGMDGPLISLVAPGHSATVRPGPSANTRPCEGGYTPLHSLPSPPGAAVSQQAPSADLLSPPARPTTGITSLPPPLTASLASLPPTTSTTFMSPPHPPAPINAGNSPEQAGLVYMQNNLSPLQPGIQPGGTPQAGPLGQFHPEGSYSVRTGSSQSFTSAISHKPPESLRMMAQKNAQARKRKQREAFRSVTPPHSPHIVGEVGFPSVMAASHVNEGEPSKRFRTETPLEPFPTFEGSHQANESRPRQQLFPGYVDNRQAAPPATAYTNYQQTQAANPPYMISQETQTAPPAHMINQQTQASIPRPDTLPTRVDPQMLAAIGPYAMLF